MRPDSFPLNHPLRFVPFLRPMVWGGRRLGASLNKALPTLEPYGESWELSDHATHRSVVADGPLAGRTLRDLMAADRTALLGRGADAHSAFPWLIKFLDCHDWLSVQVHPNDEAAERLLPGERGKTEAWFILEAQAGSRIYAGFKPGIDERSLRAALANGSVADCVHSFTPRPGDFVFLKAGTVHAVGGGVVMAEIQQTSDATFRLFDWNRVDASGKSRKLHIEEALACIDWRQGPVRAMPVEAFGEEAPRGTVKRSLVKCPYFHLDYLSAGEPFAIGSEGSVQVLLMLQGTGSINAGGRMESLTPGEVRLLPAVMPQQECRPRPFIKALLATLP